MHIDGHGVPQDYGEAIQWYRRAADQGHAGAQVSLGLMYFDGRGVPQDFVQAHLWLNLAAARHAPGATRDTAARIRDTVAHRMTPAQLARAQELASQWLPHRETFASSPCP